MARLCMPCVNPYRSLNLHLDLSAYSLVCGITKRPACTDNPTTIPSPQPSHLAVAHRLVRSYRKHLICCYHA